MYPIHRSSRATILLAFIALVTASGCNLDSSGHSVSIHRSGVWSAREGESGQRSLEGAIPAEVTRLVIVNRFGEVSVVGGSDAPDWHWELTVWAETRALAEETLGRFECRSETDGNEARWELVFPDTDFDSPIGVESNIRIRAPIGVSVRTENQFGSTVLRDLRGDVTVRNSHAEVEIAGVGGAVDAETSFAEMQLSDIGGHLAAEGEHCRISVHRLAGNARIRTSFAPLVLEEVRGHAHLRNEHGTIDARQVRGDVNAEGSFGPIHIDTNAESVTCFAEHGSVSLVLRNPELRSVEAGTSFAELVVSLPAEVAPAIAADTTFGRVHSAFPLAPGDPVERVENAPHRPRVWLENDHGDIRIERGAGPPRTD